MVVNSPDVVVASRQVKAARTKPSNTIEMPSSLHVDGTLIPRLSSGADFSGM